MQDAQAALVLGKSRSFFHAMKASNTTKYEYIKSLQGATTADKYRRYEQQVDETVRLYNDIPYILEEEGIPMRRFSLYLYSTGVYKHRDSYAIHSYGAMYSASFNGFMKRRKVLEGFSTFLKEYK